MTVDMWGLADYSGLAERLAPAALALVAEAGPLAGRRVLDVAAGTGNVAVLAAAAGAQVTASDSSPRMVELGRQRTGDEVRWLEGDAEDLPLSDGSFDVVLSSFGMIFAPRPEVAVAQARRVLVPGGVLALTTWSMGSFMAKMNSTMKGFVPPNPNAPNPMSWGTEGAVRQRLSTGFEDVRVQARSLPWQFESAAAMTAFLQAHSPTHVAAARAAGDRAGEMFAAVEALAATNGGPVDIEAEYLLIRATSC